MINNIWLAWKFTCNLKTYKICKPTVKFLIYEFNSKLLGSIILFYTKCNLNLTLYIKYFSIHLRKKFIVTSKKKKKKKKKRKEEFHILTYNNHNSLDFLSLQWYAI